MPATAPVYLPVSSPRIGALGIYHIHADEAVLAEFPDAEVRKKDGVRYCNSLQINELRYGWLRGPEGRVLDEVMLARSSDGMRILMTHGGKAVRDAVTGSLRERGFAEGDAAFLSTYRDAVYDPLLASCITEAQAAAVLDARRTGRPVPESFLATRRIVLAGAPNAGKSSLLNQLAGYDRAFVHKEVGATRDVVDELIDLGGYAVLAGDLPGYRKGGEGVDRAAWELAARALRDAECILFVVDASISWEGGTAEAAEEIARLLRGGATPVLIVLNKSDLPPRVAVDAWLPSFPGADAVRVSSFEGGNAREAIARAVSRLWR